MQRGGCRAHKHTEMCLILVPGKSGFETHSTNHHMAHITRINKLTNKVKPFKPHLPHVKRLECAL